MNATTDHKTRSIALNRLRGPGLLVLAPLQFLLGDALLTRHPLLKQVTLLGSAGLLLAMTASLVLIAGLGETGALLAEMFRKS
ncbi:MAG TPA: hypothetical protein VF275_03020 [Gammaproteobacteria bacterium]